MPSPLASFENTRFRGPRGADAGAVALGTRSGNIAKSTEAASIDASETGQTGDSHSKPRNTNLQLSSNMKSDFIGAVTAADKTITAQTDQDVQNNQPPGLP